MPDNTTRSSEPTHWKFIPPLMTSNLLATFNRPGSVLPHQRVITLSHLNVSDPTPQPLVLISHKGELHLMLADMLAFPPL